ncbi:MAG: hypothetical protein CMB16_05755 [Euryarchaeota archaeon]|nr:hypothetical protein [Euryarchaeota archaeon]|tara:strand:- start:2820 stop:3023 length:204 start_codon:yes stop_codon:yes gene_type:complete
MKTNILRRNKMTSQLRKIGLIASILSVLGSLYIYFISEDKQLGIFVGLWAPTLILLASEIENWMENK